MRHYLTALAMSSAALLAATAAQAQMAGPDHMDMTLAVPITAQNGSGEHGTATIIQRPDGLVVHVKMMGAPDGVSQPEHIHTGTCANLNPSPKYPLKLLVNGESETTIPGLKLSDLTTGGFAINVHKSTTEVATYVACGNIPAK